MSSIKKTINIPKINAELVVRKIPSYQIGSYSGLYENKHQKFIKDNEATPKLIPIPERKIDWYLFFSCRGPDKRYNHGFGAVHELEFLDFISTLRVGVEKLKELMHIEIDGRFSKKLSYSRLGSSEYLSVDLQIVANNTGVALGVGLFSGSMTINNYYNAFDLELFVEGIGNIPDMAEKMAQQLYMLD